MNNKPILAQAVAFAALLALGGLVLALVQVWKMPWVIPTTLYGLVFYMAWGRFFEGGDFANNGLENSDDRSWGKAHVRKREMPMESSSGETESKSSD